MQNALLIALTTEGTIALGQIARLATLVIDDDLDRSCRSRIQVDGARLMRLGPAGNHLVGLACSKPRDTQYGLHNNDARQQNRQSSLALIDARKIHQTGANDKYRV